MGHSISVQMAMADAKKIQELGRKHYNDGSLGINQAAFVLLKALASGEYKLTKQRKAKEPEVVSEE